MSSGPGGQCLGQQVERKPEESCAFNRSWTEARRGFFFICTFSRGLIDPSDTVDPFIPIPFLCPKLVPSIVSWNYTTVPQIGLGGRSISYPRGRTLGGSTSISTLGHLRRSILRTYYSLDYMVWTRGPASDFDRLAQVTGDPGWSWKSLLPTLIKVFYPPFWHCVAAA